MRSERPLWRNNWGISPNDTLDNSVYGFRHETYQKPPTTITTSSATSSSTTSVSMEEVKLKYINVEYQTIRRLTRSNYLLFTVKTMKDPLSSLEALPVAAECLASSFRGMSLSLLKYKGIENKKIRDVILCYLDSIASRLPEQKSSELWWHDFYLIKSFFIAQRVIIWYFVFTFSLAFIKLWYKLLDGRKPCKKRIHSLVSFNNFPLMHTIY